MDVFSYLLIMINTVHLAIVLSLSWSFLRRLSRTEWLLHPYMWFTYQYLHMVVLRLYAVAFGLVDPLVEPSVSWLVVYGYAFSFYLAFYSASVYFTFKSKFNVRSISRRKWMRTIYAPKREYTLLIVFFLLYLVAFAYNYSIGGFQTFGDARNVQVSVFGVAVNLTLNLVFFICGLCVFLYFRDRSWLAFGLLMVLIASMVMTSAISGARGILLQAIFTLIIFALVQPKISKIIFIFAPVSIIVAIGLLVTILRDTGSSTFTERISIQTATQALSDAGETLQYGEAYDLHQTVIDRFSYYPDTWVVLHERRWGGGGIPRGMYPLGSISDIYMFIPRFLWSGKPYMRFNYWTAFLVQGRIDGLDYPIGKIGEAYYVFDIFGIIFAVFYAFQFQIMYRYLRMNPNVIIQSIYFLILFKLVIQGGANLMAMVDTTLKTIIIILPIWFLFSRIFPDQQGSRNAH